MPVFIEISKPEHLLRIINALSDGTFGPAVESEEKKKQDKAAEPEAKAEEEVSQTKVIRLQDENGEPIEDPLPASQAPQPAKAPAEESKGPVASLGGENVPSIFQDEAILMLIIENCDLVCGQIKETDDDATKQLVKWFDSLFTQIVNGYKGKGDRLIDRRRLAFVNQYIAHQVISILEESYDFPVCKERMLQLIAKLYVLNPNSLAQTCIYQVFLGMMSNKELMNDQTMIRAFMMLGNDYGDKFKSNFTQEIQLLRGSLIFSLFEPVNSGDG